LQGKLRRLSLFVWSAASRTFVSWYQNALTHSDTWQSWLTCMRERTYTTHRWTTSRCARSVVNCVSSDDWMVMRSVYAMCLRTRPLHSDSVCTWYATNNSVRTQFTGAMHHS